jgi:uroporphyrinogen decarboxylase
MPLFCSACDAFGMQKTLEMMALRPEVIEAFVRRQHAFYLDILRRTVQAARGHCDICWLGDDYASQEALIMGPERWRRFIRPYLAEQVRVIHEHGLLVLLHSCGAIRAIIPDLIEIGVNGLLVFQTSAAGMAPESIARDFGGRIVFYGGIDCQQLLTFGSTEDVRAEVRRNLAAFRDCGGYIVANSHHCIANIRGENVVAMCEAAIASSAGPSRRTCLGAPRPTP